MHPPLNMIDQTDELIAIEWLREHGFDTYAEHMEGATLLPFSSGRFIRYTPQADINSGDISITDSDTGSAVRSISQAYTWYCSSVTGAREVRQRCSVSDTRNRSSVGLSSQATKSGNYTFSVTLRYNF